MKLYEVLKYIKENPESTLIMERARMAEDLGLDNIRMSVYIYSPQMRDMLQEVDAVGKLELTDKGRELLELIEYTEKWLVLGRSI